MKAKRHGRRQPQPLSEEAFARLLAKARRTNAQRDAGERAHGFAVPGDAGVWQHLRMAMQALEAGIRIGDVDCLAEGYVMLEQIEQAICPPDFRRPLEADVHATTPKERPSHRTVLYPPGGPPQLISECFPVKKLAHTQGCKYCHRTHAEWWLMDQEDYQIDGLTIILCGYCEHTSAKEEPDGAGDPS